MSTCVFLQLFPSDEASEYVPACVQPDRNNCTQGLFPECFGFLAAAAPFISGGTALNFTERTALITVAFFGTQSHIISTDRRLHRDVTWQ